MAFYSCCLFSFLSSSFVCFQAFAHLHNPAIWVNASSAPQEQLLSTLTPGIRWGGGSSIPPASALGPQPVPDQSKLRAKPAEALRVVPSAPDCFPD